MNLKKDFKKLLSIALVLFAVSGCGSPEPVRDRVFYGDQGRFGATAVHTLKTNIPPKRIYKQEWDDLRIGMICGSADDINDLIVLVDKLCANNENYCNYEALEGAKKAMRQLRSSMK